MTVVCLSTIKPEPQLDFHCILPKASLPMLERFQEADDNWVKGDMIYSVGFHRLNLIRLGTRRPDGKRNYYSRRLGREKMREVYACVLHGLNLSTLVEHIPK